MGFSADDAASAAHHLAASVRMAWERGCPHARPANFGSSQGQLDDVKVLTILLDYLNRTGPPAATAQLIVADEDVELEEPPRSRAVVRKVEFEDQFARIAMSIDSGIDAASARGNILAKQVTASNVLGRLHELAALFDRC